MKSRSSGLEKTEPGSEIETGTRGSGPAIAGIRNAMSDTDRAIGPSTLRLFQPNIDGQVGTPLRLDDVVLCRSSDWALHLIRPPRMLFFDVLRAKLKWGER